MLTKKRISEIEERLSRSYGIKCPDSLITTGAMAIVRADVTDLLEHIAAQNVQLEHFRKMRYHA